MTKTRYEQNTQNTHRAEDNAKTSRINCLATARPKRQHGLRGLGSTGAHTTVDDSVQVVNHLVGVATR